MVCLFNTWQHPLPWNLVPAIYNFLKLGVWFIKQKNRRALMKKYWDSCRRSTPDTTELEHGVTIMEATKRAGNTVKRKIYKVGISEEEDEDTIN